MSTIASRGPEAGAALLDRRAWLGRAAKAALWGAVATLGGLTRRGQAAPAADAGPPATPGFARPPVGSDQAVLASIADTIVPGEAADPGGGPGALDCGALSLIYDRFYPVRAYIPLILTAVQAEAQRQYDAPFEMLGQAEREAVLRTIQHTFPVLRHAYRFIRSVYFAGLHDATGLHALRFPGPNLGYIGHPEFSFRRPLAAERTPNGIMP